MVGYAFLFSFMKQASAENLTLTQDESLRDGMQIFKHQVDPIPGIRAASLICSYLLIGTRENTGPI